ncbi:sensor histidine kinase, partial [Sphingomonas sp. PL-96]|nr:sensor histidine kinase [Sphingomonas sp. PL-96]
MIASAKAWAKRHWPRLSLRSYLFASFFLVAALPGVGAVSLRVYENTLVRQTEAELAAQGAALAASAAALWP